jgi:hypothetical protein
LTAKDFRQIVMAEHAALFSRAQAQLDGLLRKFGADPPQSTCNLPHGIEIRDLGRAAGRCTPEGTVIVNRQLIDHPCEVRATVAHELAHAVVETARRSLLAKRGSRNRRGVHADMARRRGKWAAHGAIWQAVARELGDGGERCHQLPLKPKRRLRRFLYRSDCGAEVVLTSVRHNRLQRNRGMEYRLARDNVRVGGRHFVGEIEE